MKRNKTENQFTKTNYIRLLNLDKIHASAPTTPRKIKFKSLQPKHQDVQNYPILLSQLLCDIPFTHTQVIQIPTLSTSNNYYCKSTTKTNTPSVSQNTQTKKLQLNHKPQRFLVKLNKKIPIILSKKSQIIASQTYRPNQTTTKFHSLTIDPKFQLISDITDLKSENLSKQPQSQQPSARQFTSQKQLSKYRDCSEIDDFNNKLYGSKQIRGLLNFQKFPSENIPLKHKYKAIRASLIQYLRHLEKLKLTTKEFLSHQVFPSKPFEHSASKHFFQLCKQGQNQEIIKLLDDNKYLVYEYDHLLMTTLHWCAMRGLESTAKILLKYGADPDSQDIVGRTPLYQALIHKQNNIAYFLILNKADPWNKMNLNYEESVAENPEGKTMLHQTRRTHILLRMTPVEQRQFIWQKEQLEMYEPKKKKLASSQ
ncbi:unnamed protein product (macronuclear) [Paramecium tetraurelia]|uniref:Uncharacterized protein n=1 Tax=Paramecium tetraurelia TaxID=5888 RepID=A0DNZ7_PARTE|nr:uncharacterized protein GSPATT00018960001 [Paramecium tetraurelia]CAK84764.1 unnamed protein product [Paramecium tetraurelia]|eukprot:XP_001452161.1 hypothetical protein (macronuclear) [Paramecium tetraurelia strain d4-2]